MLWPKKWPKLRGQFSVLGFGHKSGHFCQNSQEIHRKFTGKRYKNVIKLFEILWKNGQKWPNGQKSGQSVQKWAGTFRWYINVLRRKWPKLKKTTNFYFKKINIYNTLRELFTLFFSVLATRLVLYYESVTIVTKRHQTTSNVMNSQQNSIKQHQTTSNDIKQHQTTSNDKVGVILLTQVIF